MKGYQCANHRRDSVQTASVWSLSYHCKSTQFGWISSARALLDCCLAAAVLSLGLINSASSAGQYRAGPQCRVSGLATGWAGWLADCVAGASRGLCLFCFILHFYFIFFHDKQRDYIIGICGNKQQAIKASDSIVKQLNAR